MEMDAETKKVYHEYMKKSRNFLQQKCQDLGLDDTGIKNLLANRIIERYRQLAANAMRGPPPLNQNVNSPNNLTKDAVNNSSGISATEKELLVVPLVQNADSADPKNKGINLPTEKQLVSMDDTKEITSSNDKPEKEKVIAIERIEIEKKLE